MSTQTNKIIMKLKHNFELSTINDDTYRHDPLSSHNKKSDSELQISSYRYLTTLSKLHVDSIKMSSRGKIFFCIYHINNSSTPFLEYLLYKYPSNKNDLCIFFWGGDKLQGHLKKNQTGFGKKKKQIYL